MGARPEGTGNAGVPMAPLVWGERDPIIPVEHAREAQTLIPSSRLEIFEGAGHFPHLDEPQRFLDVLPGIVADVRAELGAARL